MSTASFSKLGEYGRLGNAMFSLSALMSYCKRYRKTALINNWKYLKYFVNLPSPTENIVVDKIYNEPNFHYNEIPFFDGPVEILGYFQSTKYFENIDVNVLFELKPEYQKQVDDLYEKINPQGLRTCATHHRFGDYLLPPHDAYHGVLYQDYYDKAVKELYTLEEAKKIKVIVCSDEINKAKLMYNKLDEFDIYFSEGNNEIIDMFLMAKCADNIIANSSFSYWSYLLNKNPYKRCCAPKQWFKGAGLDTKDLYTKEMILI